MKNILITLMLLACFSSFATAFEDMAKLPKLTTAKIKRGTKEIPVDLTQKNQIKDYDVILLDEGVYSTLGNSNAKYVRVIGKGQGKTFISSMAPGSAPILVNSTEFWDVTMADAQFQVVDLSGLWAVNVEFNGAILVRPASLDKPAAFTIRAIMSEVFDSGTTVLKVDDETGPGLLAYEDKIDRDDSMVLKDRLAYKGLLARGANYLYQMKNFKPQYDHARYMKLTQQAKAAKAKGHLYVSMLFWAEADRLSGHSRFDEVLKEITPLNQVVNQDCGCTVEGQGLANFIKKDIEKNLYAKIPATGLPGKCKIEALHVNEGATVASARLQAQLDKTSLFKSLEKNFQTTAIAHASGKTLDDEFDVGAEAMKEPVAPPKKYTAVADVNMPGMKKTFTSGKTSLIDSLTKAFNDKFASRIKAATAKLASTDLFTKMEGSLVATLFGSELERQNSYEELHEQQFGRKVSGSSAMSSVMSY